MGWCFTTGHLTPMEKLIGWLGSAGCGQVHQASGLWRGQTCPTTSFCRHQWRWIQNCYYSPTRVDSGRPCWQSGLDAKGRVEFPAVGFSILDCQHCSVEVPWQWGHALSHICGQQNLDHQRNIWNLTVETCQVQRQSSWWCITRNDGLWLSEEQQVAGRSCISLEAWGGLT